MRSDSCDDTVVMLVYFFLQLTCHLPPSKSLSLPSSNLQTPSSSFSLPSLSLGRATVVSARLTRHSALALCNPANPISLATRTKELNDTAPLQEREKERERGKKTQHKFLRIHGRSAGIYTLSSSLHSSCHASPSASPSPSCKGAQNGLEMASMG